MEAQISNNLPEVGANNVVNSIEPSGLFSDIAKKISDNKIVIYIAIGVVILGIAVYFLYFKNKKETMNSNKNESKSNIQSNDKSDLYVLDSNGVPTKIPDPKSNKIEPLPIPNQQPSQQEIEMLQKQMLEKQQQQQMMMLQQQQMLAQQQQQQMLAQQQQQNRIKLQHPVEMDETPASDELNAELARIQSNEDENVAQHNLTNSELAEINHKLEMMNQQ